MGKKEYRRDWAARTYRERKEAGLCFRCGSPVSDGRVDCNDCREKQNRRQIRRLKKKKGLGLCIRCNKPVQANSCFCIKHKRAVAKLRKNIRNKRISSGLCYRCGRPAVKLGSRCEACLWKEYIPGLRRSAKDRGHVVRASNKVLALISKMPCHYCGKIDVRGFNGIDRKNSDYGYVKGNLLPSCWIHNQMKGTLSYEEFLKGLQTASKYLNRGY